MMPLYDYECPKCGKAFTGFNTIADRGKANCPDCKCRADKIISPFSLVTDTSFCMTGKHDNRLGGPKIEGRADWKRRLEQKGYEETTNKDIQDGVDRAENYKFKPVTDF